MAFLKVKAFYLDCHLLNFDFSVSLVISALLNAFVMKGALIPLIILVFKCACLPITDLKASVNVVNTPFFNKQSIFGPRPENRLSFSKQSPQKLFSNCLVDGLLTSIV